MTSADKWTKEVTGTAKYKDMKSFDGQEARWDKCDSKTIAASCNIVCNNKVDCKSALSCEELLAAGGITDGFLWKYAVVPLRGDAPIPANGTNSSSGEPTEVEVLASVTAVADFVSDPTGPDYKEACSFTFYRFAFDDQIECEGNMVVSIMSTDDLIRSVLIGGIVARVSAMLFLWVQASSTKKNQDPTKNIRLTMCLSTPAACCLVCGEGRKQVLEDALVKPPASGCLPFYSLLCHCWLLIALILMTVGIPVTLSTAAQWLGVVLEAGMILKNLKDNVRSGYKQKHPTYCCCVRVPWCYYAEDDAVETTKVTPT